MKKVIVKPSPVQGKGVFAMVNFKKGDLILKIDDSRIVDKPHPLLKGESEHHRDYFPDGRIVLMQEPERYINHSCDPNSFVQAIDDIRYAYARKDIPAGQEITYDYCIDGFGDVVWKCNCGSEKCRKTIHLDFFHLPRSLQIEYLPYLSETYKEWFKEQVDELIQEANI